MPTKLGNGGTSQEAYNPQDGKYTDEGNISQEEAEAMRYYGKLVTPETENKHKNELVEAAQKYFDYYKKYGEAPAEKTEKYGNIQKASFDEYYEEYDWAYEHLENLIDNNDFGYPEFEELEEEKREAVLQEAFVRYLDDGNDFNSSMQEDEVLNSMYNYIEEIMNENQSISKKPENNSYLNFMRRNDYGFDYSQNQNHPERTWQHGEQLYNRRNNKNKKQLFPID